MEKQWAEERGEVAEARVENSVIPERKKTVLSLTHFFHFILII